MAEIKSIHNEARQVVCGRTPSVIDCAGLSWINLLFVRQDVIEFSPR